MLWGTFDDMMGAIKRLEHFSGMFKADGPFTSLSAFGRNLALFYDFGDEADRPSASGFAGGFVLCAGAGAILAKKCDNIFVSENMDMQADIAAWWWRTNEFVRWKVMA